MAKRGKGGGAALIIVAAAAFALGRGTAGDNSAAPVDGPQAQAIFESSMQSPVAQSDAGLTPDALPFSSHEPNRIHGGNAFSNCSEARAAGAAPVYAGDPGYAARLDRDGDGVGCE